MREFIPHDHFLKKEGLPNFAIGDYVFLAHPHKLCNIERVKKSHKIRTFATINVSCSIVFQMRKFIISLLLVGLISGVGYYAYAKFANQSGNLDQPSASKAVEEKVWPVRGVKAQRQDHKIFRTVFGETIAPRTTNLSFQIAGCIQTAGENAKEGGVVKKGELLARLDTREIEQSIKLAELAIDESAAKQEEIKFKIAGLKNLQKFNEEQRLLAKSALERQETLSGRGATSAKIIDEAKFSLSEAKSLLAQNLNEQEALNAALVTLKKQGSIAKEQLELTRLKLEQAQLVAPHDGRIATVSTRKGACVSPMQTLAILVDTSKTQVALKLPVRFYNALSATHSLDQPIEIFTGDTPLGQAHVSQVLPQTDETTGDVKLILDIDGDDADTNRQVVAGQQVQARVMVEELKDVVELPNSALFADRYVYRIDNDRLKEIEVKPVHQDSKHFYVANEINSGDLILTSHISQAKPDLLVQVLGTKAAQ